MNGRCEGGDQGRGGGPDVCTFATCLGHLCTTCRKYKTARNSAGSTNSCTYREKRLSLSTNLHQNTHTVNGTCSGVSESLTFSLCAKTGMVQTTLRYSQYGPEPLIKAS